MYGFRMPDHSHADRLNELEQLRHEYQSAIGATDDPFEARRLNRIVRELDMCVERMRQEKMS
jgi:hypothetical protein